MTWFSIKWNHATFVLWLCRCVLSHVCLFVTPWTVACQAPLPMEFSRQEYWSGLPFPCPGDLPNPGIEPMSLVSPALAVGFFTTSATWEARPVTGLFIYPPGPSMLLQMARFIFFCFFKTEWCSLVNTYHIYFNPFIRWWTLRRFCIVAVLWRLLCSEHGTIGIKSCGCSKSNARIKRSRKAFMKKSHASQDLKGAWEWGKEVEIVPSRGTPWGAGETGPPGHCWRNRNSMSMSSDKSVT